MTIIEAAPSGARGWWRSRASARMLSGIALAVVVAGAAFAAIRLHRAGHHTGDDFALYINQARALFEGNIAEVIDNNRFLWKHSTAVTPQMYPWGFAVLLAPFVRLWGIDAYDRLKLVEVAAFCIWLLLFHGIVRRRTGRTIALALTAVFAASPLYLRHTDQLLTEFPHMMATALAIWWLDRIISRHRMVSAPTGELVILGLLIVAAYNVRREGIVLLFAVGLVQLVDALNASRQRRAPPWPARRWLSQVPWRTLALPHATFAAGAFIAQALLPSTLLPDNDNSPTNIPARLFGDENSYPRALTAQLGLGSHPLAGKLIMATAAVGIVFACIRRPRLNLPLAGMLLATMAVVGTHFRQVDRYFFQVTPYVAFFVLALGLVYADNLVSGRRLAVRWRRTLLVLIAAPALWAAAVNVWMLPSHLDAASRFRSSGVVQPGGLTVSTAPAFEAVERLTDRNDAIVFYRARTLTLYTDRAGVQTTSLTNAARLGDYFLQNLGRDFSQPRTTRAELEARGWAVVWEDRNWRLWRINEQG